MGSLAYADDVLLLSPTLGSLNGLLTICEQYSKEYNILFNASKTKLMVFGRKLPKVKVMFQGTWVSQVDSENTVKSILEIIFAPTEGMIQSQ